MGAWVGSSVGRAVGRADGRKDGILVGVAVGARDIVGAAVVGALVVAVMRGKVLSVDVAVPLKQMPVELHKRPAQYGSYKSVGKVGANSWGGS